MKQRLQLMAGSVALTALLTYTLVHTGGLLAAYVEPSFVGYIAAFGIESAIVSLSLRIGDVKRSGQKPGFFYFALVSAVVVSAIANISEGFAVSQGVKLTVASVNQLDIVQAIIGISATGLISLLVLVLSEIVGTDVNVAVKASRRQATKAALSTPNLTQKPNALQIANERRL